jgi:hypothetical protein
MSRDYVASWVSLTDRASAQLDPSWVKVIAKAIQRMVAAGKTDREIHEALWFECMDPDRQTWDAREQYVRYYLENLRMGGTEETVREAPRKPLPFTERQIRVAAQTVREREDRHPTQEKVAKELYTSEATLKRAMKALGMPRWPPAPPED